MHYYLLHTGLLLSGRVIDENREAIGHSGQLNVWHDDGTEAYWADVDAEDGSFSVAVEPGRYRILGRFLDSQPPFPTQELGAFEVEADMVVELVARRGVSVRGTVVDEQGQRLSSGTLQFRHERGAASGSSSLSLAGTYAVSLIPGRYRMSVDFEEGSGMPPSQPLGAVSVTRDTVLDVAIQGGELFRGRIVDATGAGMADADVSASSLESSTSNRAVTDAEGFFAMRLLSGRYRLKKLGDAENPSINWNLGVIEVPARDIIEVRQPAGAVLRGEMLDVRGNPVQAVLQLLPGPFRLRHLLEGETLVSATIYESDPFAIQVEPGRYAVVVGRPSVGLSRVAFSRLMEDYQTVGQVTPEFLLGIETAGTPQ